MAKVKVVVPKRTTGRSTQTSPSDGGVLDRIRPIGFNDDDSGIKIMLYGRSGTGKTTLWGTFPGRTMAIICSGSDQPGELRSIDTVANRKRIEQVVLKTADELPELIQFLRTKRDTYDNVVLDHVSGYYDLVLRGVLGLDDESVINKKFGAITMQQYGEAFTTFKTNVRPLLGLPQNVVMIGQERTFGGAEDEGGNLDDAIKPTVGVSLSEKLTGWLNTTVDYLARTFIREEVKTKKVRVAGEVVESRTKTGKIEYCLHVGPHPTFQTKFRMPGGVGETVIVNPTYDSIMALIRGKSAADETGE